MPEGIIHLRPMRKMTATDRIAQAISGRYGDWRVFKPEAERVLCAVQTAIEAGELVIVPDGKTGYRIGIPVADEKSSCVDTAIMP